MALTRAKYLNKFEITRAKYLNKFERLEENGNLVMDVKFETEGGHKAKERIIMYKKQIARNERRASLLICSVKSMYKNLSKHSSTINNAFHYHSKKLVV